MFDNAASTFTLASFLVVSTLVCVRYFRRRSYLPPGPSGLPIIGNLFDIPNHYPWLEYERWALHYGWDIVHLSVLGTNILVVNSRQAATDLFEKKGAIYSDRPPMPMMTELIGLGWHFGFMPKDESWKNHRRMFSQEFNPSVAAPRYRPIQLRWTHRLLKNLLDSPDKFFDHLQHMASGIALEDTFGLQVQPSGVSDPFIGAATQAIQAMGSAGIFGSYLVDFLPALKWAPSFSGFRRKATVWKKSADIAWAVPFDLAKKNMLEGTAAPSICLGLLNSLPQDGDREKNELVIRQSCAAMFASGSAATVAGMATFFLAMLKYPEVQAKAQAEIDSVLQGHRLPSFDDLTAMPYINALVKEVLRWNPIVPLAFPHRLEENDTYNGYHLPAGSIVFPNAWAILHDPIMYPNPDKFDPSRFLTEDNQPNPTVKAPDAAFGFARRVCPGKASALSSLTLAMASTLASFDISKAVDANGKAITPSGEYTDGLLRYPKPFKCNIIPRSKEAATLVDSSVPA